MASFDRLFAMVKLLDDADMDIVKQIEQELLKVSEEDLAILKTIAKSHPDLPAVERLNYIIGEHSIQKVRQSMEEWLVKGGQNLFEGLCLLSTYRYPEISRQSLSNQLDQIKLDVWLELKPDMTPLEKIRIFNRVFYKEYGFNGNMKDYFSEENSYINKAIENRTANPITISCIYSIIAHRLGLPIFGVNLPQHFILAYVDNFKFIKKKPIQGYNYLNPGEYSGVSFYINAFNDGAIFSRWNIDQYLKQLKIPQDERYYKPCSNIEIIMRMCRNLIWSYQKNNEMSAADDMVKLLRHIENASS